MLLSDKEWLDKWNTLHCTAVKDNVDNDRNGEDAADFRNDLMADYCEELISLAKASYYDTGDIIMTDAYYDRVEYYLKSLRPESEMLKKVGN